MTELSERLSAEEMAAVNWRIRWITGETNNMGEALKAQEILSLMRLFSDTSEALAETTAAYREHLVEKLQVGSQPGRSVTD